MVFKNCSFFATLIIIGKQIETTNFFNFFSEIKINLSHQNIHTKLKFVDIS